MTDLGKAAPLRVLLTGATGLIGRVVLEDLLRRGYRVRGTTSRSPPKGDDQGATLEWRRFDFMTEIDYDDLVSGCDAVLHLAGEKGQKAKMQCANVDATKRLADAAERANVQAFCYTSSASVYGSGLKKNMDEDAPVLTVERDVRSEYWALDYVRNYGRTKLAGELALHQAAKRVRYVVLRPTFVVGIPEILGIRDWSYVKRMLTAHRHAHYIYVGDVSDALIWFMERAIAGGGTRGGVETFNLSDDDCPEPTHADFLRKAYSATGDARFRVLKMPWLADWMHDFLRFRTLPLRNPLWRMYFPSDRLRATGYRPRFGMARAQEIALETLRTDAKSTAARNS